MLYIRQISGFYKRFAKCEAAPKFCPSPLCVTVLCNRGPLCSQHIQYTQKEERCYLSIQSPTVHLSFLLVGVIRITGWIYRVSQEECARLREGVPYFKVYRYNPKYLCPKLNGYGDNGQRNVWSSGGSTHCTCQLTVLSMSVLECGVIWRQFS
jgi:hypothetical protein